MVGEDDYVFVDIWAVAAGCFDSVCWAEVEVLREPRVVHRCERCWRECHFKGNMMMYVYTSSSTGQTAFNIPLSRLSGMNHIWQ